MRKTKVRTVHPDFSRLVWTKVCDRIVMHVGKVKYLKCEVNDSLPTCK